MKFMLGQLSVISVLGIGGKLVGHSTGAHRTSKHTCSEYAPATAVSPKMVSGRVVATGRNSPGAPATGYLRGETRGGWDGNE